MGQQAWFNFAANVQVESSAADASSVSDVLE